MSTQANPRCQVTTVDPIAERPTAIWCILPAGHAGMHHVDLDDGSSRDWHGSIEPGVWLVSYEHDGGDHVIPFATEVEALRFVNGEHYHRSWFVPFGANLHDVVHGIGKFR